MRFEAFCFLMAAVLSDNVPCVFTSTLAAGEQWPLEMGGGDENENYVNPENSVSTSPLTNNGQLGLGREIIFARDNLATVPCATGMCQISHQKGW